MIFFLVRFTEAVMGWVYKKLPVNIFVQKELDWHTNLLLSATELSGNVSLICLCFILLPGDS